MCVDECVFIYTCRCVTVAEDPNSAQIYAHRAPIRQAIRRSTREMTRDLYYFMQWRPDGVRTKIASFHVSVSFYKLFNIRCSYCLINSITFRNHKRMD